MSRCPFVGIAVIACACIVAGCAAKGPPPGASATVVSKSESSDSVASDGYPFRERAAGTIVLFVRNVISEKVQDTAEDLVGELVDRCDPAFDAVAIVEPGVALAWPGIRDLADKELAVRRRWRAVCLHKTGTPREIIDDDAKDQVTLVIDERTALRWNMLAGVDPGGDIVVAAFGAHGETLHVASVAAGAGYNVKHAAVDAAIAAVRKSARGAVASR